MIRMATDEERAVQEVRSVCRHHLRQMHGVCGWRAALMQRLLGFDFIYTFWLLGAKYGIEVAFSQDQDDTDINRN